MTLITDKTSGCITFISRTDQPHYINITKDGGCYSYVGNMSRYQSLSPQPLSLGNGCIYIGTIVHELMHAMGFKHEQQRWDRNDTIEVRFDNVQSNYISQFDLVQEERSNFYGSDYDLKSIMQYGEYSFSKNREKTIVPRDGSSLVPAYSKTYEQVLTETDIKAVHKMYNFVSPTQEPATQEPSTSQEPTTQEPATQEPTTQEQTIQRGRFRIKNNKRNNVKVYKNAKFLQTLQNGDISEFTVGENDELRFDSVMTLNVIDFEKAKFLESTGKKVKTNKLGGMNFEIVAGVWTKEDATFKLKNNQRNNVKVFDISSGTSKFVKTIKKKMTSALTVGKNEVLRFDSVKTLKKIGFNEAKFLEASGKLVNIKKLRRMKFE